MGQPSFWDNPEKAQQIIAQLKPLNGLLKPYEELESAAGDVQALVELAGEDEGLEAELERELGPFERRLDEFEMRAMLDGPQDASNAYLRIQAGTGGTETGLAFRILEAGYRLAIPRLFAALLLLSLSGIAIYLVIDFAARLALRHWHERALDEEPD